MSHSVTKSDLVATISADTGLKKADAERALVAMTRAIQSALHEGNKVTLVGFGTFDIAHRAERAGRNPQTREPMTISASNTVRFKPSKAMKEAVNES